MTRERIVRLAMRAYPREVRASSDGEMLDTALDLSAGSWQALLRESGALLRGGLSARARVNARGDPLRLAADACCVAATLWSTWVLISLGLFVRMLVRSQQPVGVGWPLAMALLVIAIVLALIGWDRIAGVFAFGLIALFLFVVREHFTAGGSTAHQLASLFVPIVCYGVMALAPRARTRDPRRLLWLLAAAALVVGGPTLLPAALGVPKITLLLVGVYVVGVVRLPVDPRLAIASAIVLVGFEVSRWTSSSPGPISSPLAAAIAAAPIVLVTAAWRVRWLRRQRIG
jgi:hypothetical protein